MNRERAFTGNVYMAFYDWKWTKKDEFLQNLRDLLKPIILAEGYSLLTEDAGKQVYIRGERSITQKAKHYFFDAPDEEVRIATRLTVGYVLTPSETRAQFTWENPYFAEYGRARPFLNRQALEEATKFYEYLEDWYKEMVRNEEKADPPPLEGQ